MAATFFDTTDSDHLALLNLSIRTHAERDTVVDEAERDILLQFTVRTGVNTYRVDLEGYDDTTPASSHATLKAALLRAVARVASHRLRNYEVNALYKSERLELYQYDRGSAGGGGVTMWPDGWNEELKAFYSEVVPWIHI